MECQLDNATIHYEVRGAGRPVIMLHGMAADHRALIGVMEPSFEGRSDWQRIYIDLPGMGKSPGADWIIGSDQVLKVLCDFIDRVIPDQHFTLVGQSYGGYLARGILHEKPDWVDGMLLMCPVVNPETSRRELPSPIVLVRNPALIAQIDPSLRERFETYVVVQSEEIFKRVRDELVPGFLAGDQAFITRLRNEQYNFSFDVDELPAPFEKPVLIVTGRHDAIVGYREALNLAANYPRGSAVTLDRAGHMVFLEQESLFNHLAGEWLDRLEEVLPV